MILLDAGPIVAVLDRSDRHHRRCVEAVATLREGLATTWLAVAEALDRLDGVPQGSEAVWALLEESHCRVLALEPEDAPRLRDLTVGPRSVRLRPAAASLVCVAERHGIETLLTLDRLLGRQRRGRRRLFRRTYGCSRGRL